jgi:hypothetical protein
MVLPTECDPTFVLNPNDRKVLAAWVERQIEDDAKPDEEVSHAVARRDWAAKKYQSPDWSLGNVLSWIAFRDPELICRFESVRSAAGKVIPSRHKGCFFGMPTKGTSRRSMIVGMPDHVLLAALQNDDLRAIRDGVEIPSLFWFGKDVRDLTDDLRFRRAEVLKCWPAVLPDTTLVTDGEGHDAVDNGLAAAFSVEPDGSSPNASGENIRPELPSRLGREPDNAIDVAPPTAALGRPGPKAGEKTPKKLAYDITLKILDDDDRRPPSGYGRRTSIAKMVNGELSRGG